MSLIACACLLGREPERTDEVQWVWPVAIREASSKELTQEAERLKKVLGVGLDILYAKQNPVCCIWLEIDNWLPNPGEPGYIIVIQGGGARVLATSPKELKSAIDAIEKNITTRDGKAFLPAGIISSYAIARTQS